MTKPDIDIIIRSRTDGDTQRIFSDWLLSYRDAPVSKPIPNATYYYWHHRIIEGLMVDPTAAWVVAVSSKDPTFIYGWACGQSAGGTLVLHYIYVRKIFRRFGIGQRLLATLGVQRGQGVVTTHHTFPWRTLAESYGVAAAFNPYLFAGRAPVPTVTADADRAMLASRRAIAYNGFDRSEPPSEDEYW